MWVENFVSSGVEKPISSVNNGKVNIIKKIGKLMPFHTQF
jgi:hypothetical protein